MVLAGKSAHTFAASNVAKGFVKGETLTAAALLLVCDFVGFGAAFF